MDRLLVAAPHKSSGKTTVSIGLCAALAAGGTRVQPFKKGPDYIDPLWLARAAGRPCLNLDPYLMDDAALERCFRTGIAGADLAFVEGNHGLHDGMALDGSNSNAAVARRLGLPVVLVVDTRGMSRGIAPLVLGFQAFERDIRIAGVILNRVGGARHEQVGGTPQGVVLGRGGGGDQHPGGRLGPPAELGDRSRIGSGGRGAVRGAEVAAHGPEATAGASRGPPRPRLPSGPWPLDAKGPGASCDPARSSPSASG